MWNTKRYLGGLAALLLILAACAPKPAPASLPTPPAYAPSQAGLTPAAPVVNAEDAAWAKVVHAAKTEGALIVYGGTMIGDIGIAMKQGFKRATGLDVEFIIGSGPQLIERVKTERRAGANIASILESNSATLYSAKVGGITQTIGPLPEVRDKAAWLVDPVRDDDGHILANGFIFTSPWVNTKLVRPEEEPRSYRELIEPRWKGKVSLIDPNISVGSSYIYHFLVRRDRILDDTYFRELGKVAVITLNNNLDSGLLAGGQYAISFSQAPNIMMPVVLEGASVKPIDIREGLVGSMRPAVVLIAGAPHPNAARVFINWWFSLEGQYLFCQVGRTESLRKGVPNFKPPAIQLTPSRLIIPSPEDEEKANNLQREKVVKDLLLGK